MNSPLSWIGGKSRLRKVIVAMFPQHLCYVEVFCGAAWVLFEKERSQVEVINDINGELINFYRVIKYKYKEFVEAFDWILVSREVYKNFKMMDVINLTVVERAVRFYYLVKCGFANAPESFNFGYGTTRMVRVTVESIGEIIEVVYKRLQKVIIENLPFDNVIRRYDRPHTLFYLDPPYYGKDYYQHKIGKEGHIKLAEILKKIKGKFILSINDLAEVRKLYRGFKIKKVNVLYSVCKQKDARYKRGELLITNFKVPK